MVCARGVAVRGGGRGFGARESQNGCKGGGMVEHSLDARDALDLLVAAPGTKEDKQEFLKDEFDVRVPKTSYDLMWERLADELNEDQAAEAVCALVLSASDSRAI